MDNGQKVDITDAASYTYTVSNVIANRNVVAYVKANTYTVSYNANGGTGAPASQTKTHDVSLTLSSDKPTREGYTFTGWLGSDNKTYQPGSSYTGNANLTLTAQWKLNTYTVSYNANGGTGAPASQTKSHGVDLTLSSDKPTREGYSFTGWLGSDGNTYQPGGSYTGNANLTLTAQWKALYQYELKFDANAGGDTTVTGMPADKSSNGAVSESTYTFTWTESPSRDGYSFIGWALSADSTDKAADKSYTVTGKQSEVASVTLYAIWQEDTVKIQYKAVANGSVSLAEETLGIFNGSAQGSVPTPETNYEFVGWYTDEACATPVTANWVDSSDKLTPQKVDGKYQEATYYAKFERMTASLTITKSGMNDGENAIIKVTGEGLDNGITVSVPNNGSITINDLLVGADYTVTEDTSWSRCYTPSGLGTITLAEGGSTVNVSNSLNTSKTWLRGETTVNNVFNPIVAES